MLALAVRAAAEPANDDHAEDELESCDDAPADRLDDRDDDRDEPEPELQLDPLDEDDLAPIAGVPELSGAGTRWRMLPRRSRWGAVDVSIAWRRTAYAPIATPPHTAAELWLLATWRQ